MNLRNEIAKNREFLNNIFITMGIGLVVNSLNYLFNVFLARNLDTTNFGFYNAAIAIITLAQIPVLAIQTAVTKKVADNKGYNLKQFKRRSTLQLTIIASIVSVIFYLLGDQISQIAHIPIKYIPTLTVVVFGAILTPSIKGFLLGLEKILSFNLILLFETVLKFLLGYIAIHYAMDLALPILACVIPSFITLLLLPFISTKSKKTPKSSISLDYRSIVLFFVTYLLLNMPANLSLILANPDIRASYGALTLIGKIVYFASITIASVMLSKLASTKKEERKKSLLISLAFAFLTGIGISAIYLLFTRDIVHFIFGDLYMDIVGYVVPYSVAIIGYALAYLLITSLLVDDSYIHIYFLVLLTLLQMILFRVNNSTLHDIFINQVIIYGVLGLFVLSILIYYLLKKKNEKDKEETLKRV